MLTLPKRCCCGSFHSHYVNILTGPQYWTDQSDLSSDLHNDLNFHPQSSHGLRNLPVGHKRNSGYEYYQGIDYKLPHHSPQQFGSRVENTWSCPQGFEPSSGICQGKLILSHVLLTLLRKFKLEFGCE